jgi:hypothetical protein
METPYGVHDRPLDFSVVTMSSYQQEALTHDSRPVYQYLRQQTRYDAWQYELKRASSIPGAEELITKHKLRRNTIVVLNRLNVNIFVYVKNIGPDLVRVQDILTSRNHVLTFSEFDNLVTATMSVNDFTQQRRSLVKIK